jgi:hypothetical protein
VGTGVVTEGPKVSAEDSVEGSETVGAITTLEGPIVVFGSVTLLVGTGVPCGILVVGPIVSCPDVGVFKRLGTDVTPALGIGMTVGVASSGVTLLDGTGVPCGKPGVGPRVSCPDGGVFVRLGTDVTPALGIGMTVGVASSGVTLLDGTGVPCGKPGVGPRVSCPDGGVWAPLGTDVTPALGKGMTVGVPGSVVTLLDGTGVPWGKPLVEGGVALLGVPAVSLGTGVVEGKRPACDGL